MEENYRINLLRDLIRRQMLQSSTHIPSGEWNKKEQTLFLYSQQLLSSSMSPSISLNDHQAIMERLKVFFQDRKIQQYDHALKLLNESREMSKWKIIYFLIRLDEKGRMPIKFIESNVQILKSLKIGDDGNRNIASSPPLSLLSMSSSLPGSFPFVSNSVSSERRIELIPSAAFVEYSKSKSHVNEISLIKDCLYAMQGIDTNLIKNQRADSSLSIPIRSVLEEFACFGILFKNIERIIEFSKQSLGLIKQSFAHHLRMEMRNFIQHISDFELKIEKISLIHTLVWLRGETRQIIESLHEIAIKSEHLFGAKLISMMNIFVNQSSSSFQSIVALRLLNSIKIPFEKIIRKWIFTGQIEDLYQEFFITLNITLNRENIPNIMTIEDATRILMVGRTRLFLNSCPSFNEASISIFSLNQNEIQNSKDQDQNEIQKDSSNNNKIQKDSSNNNENIENDLMITCNNLHDLYSKELARIILRENCLKMHISLIYDLLFYGRDSFFITLVNQIGEEALNKPASGGYYFKHALYGVLDAALRERTFSTSTQSSPSTPSPILDPFMNLDIKLLENISNSDNVNSSNLSSSSSASSLSSHPSCWDIFSLEYRVSFPLNIILTDSLFEDFMNLSQFLWQLKKTEFLLRVGHERLIADYRQNQNQSHSNQNHSNHSNSFNNIPEKRDKVDYFRFQLLYHELVIMCKQIISICYESIQLAFKYFYRELEKFSKNLFDLDQLIDLMADLVDLIKKRCLPWSNHSLRSKLLSLLSSMIKLVNLSDSFIASNKSLGEIRVTFQTIARQSQSDIDIFLMQIQKEANSMKSSSKRTVTIDDLDWERVWMTMLDVNEYHQRRSGFDINKYGKTILIN